MALQSSALALALPFACSLVACAATPPERSRDGVTLAREPSRAARDAPPREALPPAEPAGSGPCGLRSAAFCETFETAHPGGRAGDLDERLWSFARWGHETRQFFVRVPAKTYPDTVFPAELCGKPFSGLLPHLDAVLCKGPGPDGALSGQLNELFDDQGDFAFNSMRIRQPFDFADRAGTITFEVDAKINPFNLGHGWWIELFVTEDPAPLPYHEAPGVLSFPRNGIGFAFQGFNSCEKSKTLWNNALNRVIVTREHRIVHDYAEGDFKYDSWESRCFTTADGRPNRFRFVLSKDHAEVSVTDHDRPGVLRRIARVENLDLTFTRGYVHLQHAQYNARKDGGVTPTQVYRWDNAGFDGPVLPVPRSYDAPDNDAPDIDGVGGRLYGYYLTDRAWTSLPFSAVDTKGARRATLGFAIHTTAHGRALEYRFNGGAVHRFGIPTFGTPGGVRGFAVDVPLRELSDGENRLEVRMAAPQIDQHEVLGNVELTLELVD